MEEGSVSSQSAWMWCWAPSVPASLQKCHTSAVFLIQMPAEKAALKPLPRSQPSVPCVLAPPSQCRGCSFFLSSFIMESGIRRLKASPACGMQTPPRHVFLTACAGMELPGFSVLFLRHPTQCLGGVHGACPKDRESEQVWQNTGTCPALALLFLPSGDAWFPHGAHPCRFSGG